MNHDDDDNDCRCDMCEWGRGRPEWDGVDGSWGDPWNVDN